VDRRELHWPSAVVDGAIALFGVWTAFCHLLVLFEARFITLLRWSWVPAAAAVALLWWMRRDDTHSKTDSTEATLERSPQSAWKRWLPALLLPVIVVGIYERTGNLLLFWCLASLIVLGLYRLQFSASDGVAPWLTRQRLTILLIVLMVLAATLTLVAHNFDLDDAFYLNLAVRLYDQPERVIHAAGGSHEGLPHVMPHYRLLSWELLVAELSALLDRPPGDIYYLVLPALMAALVVLVHWLLLERFFKPDLALLGLCVAVVALVVWGEGHRTYGNFGFVRLFQGKAVLLTFGVPATLHSAIRYLDTRSPQAWLRVALIQLAAVGFTPTGLVVAPVVVLLVAVGALMTAPRDLRQVMLLLASTVFAVGGVAFFVITRVVEVSQLGAEASRPPLGLTSVLGSGLRGAIALVALLALATVGCRARHRLLVGFSAASVVLLFNPWLSTYLGYHVGRSLGWRLFWAVPLPLLLGVFAARLGELPRGRFPRIAAPVAVALVFAMVPGLWTTSAQNGTRLGRPSYKVHATYEVARRVVEISSPDSLVLAPTVISGQTVMQPGHPRVVAVRKGRGVLWRGALGDLKWRAPYLVSRISRRTQPGKLEPFFRDLDTYGIDIVVFHEKLRWSEELGNRLAAMGFSVDRVMRFEIWSRALNVDTATDSGGRAGK
jgi:hypothetical protein